MKKIFTIFLSFCLIVTLLPIDTKAETKHQIEQNDLIELACSIFPEYEQAIRGNSKEKTYSNRTSNSDIVLKQSRSISSDETLSYIQFADGNGLIVNSSRTVAQLTETGSSVAGFSGGSNYYYSYKVTPTDTTYFSGIFYLDDLVITIYNSSYDWISSDGTASVNSSIYCKYNKTSNGRQETSTSAADLCYNITFIPDRAYGVHSSGDIQVTLDFGARNNNVYVDLR